MKRRNKTLTDTIFHIFEITDEEHNRKSIARELTKRKIKVKNLDTISVILSRLEKEGYIERTTRGFYKLKTADVKSKIEDLITYGEKRSIPRLHRLFFTFNPRTVKEKLRKAGYDLGTPNTNPNKRGGGGFPHYKIDISTLNELCNTFGENLYQRYTPTKITEKIDGGYQDRFRFTTGERHITVQTYGTGSVNIIVDCSEDPLHPADLIPLYTSIDTFFQSAYNYSFLRDLIDFFFVTQVEFNRDGKVIEAIPKGEVVTVRELSDWAFRFYSKEIEDTSYFREEYIYADGKRPPTASQFLLSLESALQGGVNVQYLIKAQQDVFNNVQYLQKLVENQEKMLRYLIEKDKKEERTHGRR